MVSDFRVLNSLIEDVHLQISEYSTSLDFLMVPDFIKCHSYFKTLECMKLASGLIAKYSTEKELFSSSEWDYFVKDNTAFETWKDMKMQASIVYIKYKLPLY